MALITLEEHDWAEPERSREFCRRLEEGHILFFPQSPVSPSREDLDFLLDQRQSQAGYHKNIAYRPGQDRISGLARELQSEGDRLLSIMRNHSRRSTRFLERLLAPYASGWRLDYASFRSQEEQGRRLRVRARNDLIHVDAFPTRPTGGDRILRFFTNINPAESRRWMTTHNFEVLARQFAGSRIALPGPDSLRRRAGRWLARLAGSLGLPVVARSPYDDFMLRFHHFLKENREFQAGCPKFNFEFPPHSAWMVFTDLVPHAVLSGRFALEQTYIISRASLLLPEKAPVTVLERLGGVPMAG